MGKKPYFLSFTFLLFAVAVSAQRVAILTPDNADSSRSFSEKLESSFADKLKILDDSLSQAAYASVSPATPFNLTAEDSKKIGTAIGCDAFILLRSTVQRRSAYKRDEYYEAYASIYVVSSRTGRLIFWKLQSFEAPKPDKAAKLLADSTDALAAEVADKLHANIKNELNEPIPVTMEDVPDEDSLAAKGFRAPIPYRRIKPEYTAQAALYDVAATVEMTVDLDEKGTILHTEIVRWAGFGLDESVDKTVRAMNWRPAERNGKSLPMRVLLRYNFKKIEKEKSN